MPRWIMAMLIAFCTTPVLPADGLPRWDGLPAVDVAHLQGPYAGRTACPMCEHGYDAGVLVFLPAGTSVAHAAQVGRAMREAATAAGDARFRPFLVLTGATPSSALLEAVRRDDANWYVAHLREADLAGASGEFHVPLHARAHGFVFAQRRLIWSFDAAASTPVWSTDLAAHARYAMQFLRATYGEVNDSADPDSPKGRLWLAPARLTNDATFADGAIVRACFSDAANGARRHALVAMTPADDARARTRWARSDTAGCVSIEGVDTLQGVHVDVFSALESHAAAHLDARTLRAGRRVDVSLDARTPTAVTGREPVVGGCEGCEGVFQNLPATLSATTRLPPADEPGEPMQLSGTVFDTRGNAATGIIVYAYQTDRTGIYPEGTGLTGDAARHGRLRAWARTGEAGRYRFHTIRPGAYPNGSEPQHIHLHVIEPGRCTYYLGDVMFTDDPRLQAKHVERDRRSPGGPGIVRPEGSDADGWTVTRDIRLGMNVAGYNACNRQH